MSRSEESGYILIVENPIGIGYVDLGWETPKSVFSLQFKRPISPTRSQFEIKNIKGENSTKVYIFMISANINSVV